MDELNRPSSFVLVLERAGKIEDEEERRAQTRLFTQAGKPRAERAQAGSVLLEVVLAVVLFAAAGAVISGAMSASVASLERVRRQIQAENLAVTILSEIQIGVLPAAAAGPEVFDPPFDKWSWELQIEPMGSGPLAEAEPMQKVEVIIRQVEGPTVHRLVQWLNGSKGTETTELVANP